MNLFYPNIYKEEWLSELSRVFDTRWLGQGPLTEEFEKQFANKFNYKYCLSVNSGSSSLELAYHLVGISEGDEVLAPVFTCTATNIPLVRRRAKIKFLDINDNFTVNYDDLISKISKKTKAIVVATIGGLPIDSRIFGLAKNYKVPVIIDAAQSLGVTEDYGDYVCYSFQAIKHFTTGDGGMLVLRNEKDYIRAKKLRWFGIDREAKKQSNWKWIVNHKMALDIEEAGYKFHMNDMAACMGMVGLKHTDQILAYRKRLCKEYVDNFGDKIMCGGSYWLCMLITDNREKVMEHLQRKGIECDMVQIRNDVFSIFGGRQVLPNMDRLESKYFYLPIHPKLTVKDVKYICKEIKDENKG